MSLVINLTPSEEARLVAAAKETGVDAAELAKRLVTAHLPAVAGDNEPEPKQGKSEGQNGAQIVSDSPTQELFARWAPEDALLTEAERAESDRIYAELEKSGIPRTQI